MYRCNRIYKCACSRKVKERKRLPRVSKTTALRHRKEAIEQRRITGLAPYPSPVDSDSESSSSSSSKSSDSSSSGSPACSPLSHNSPLPAHVPSPSIQNSSPSPKNSSGSASKSHPSHSGHFDSTVENEANTTSSNHSISEDFDSIDYEHLTTIDAISPTELRLKSTMKRCLWILQFRLRFHLVDDAVDYLMKREKSLFPDEVQISTFKGLKKAICSYASLNINSTHYCTMGHRALGVRDDGDIEKCNHQMCVNMPPRTASFKSFSLWDQLKLLIQSPHYGPLMFNYHQERLRNLNLDVNEAEEWFSDYYDGHDFKNYIRERGGVENFMDHIFLDISTDGVQPHRSSMYSYWPVILFVCNIPPEERFKAKNVVPLMFIPGSRTLKRGPQDLHSFLKPLYDELKQLAKGMKVVRWDGRMIICKCEPWRVKLDLAACKSLTNLNGFNGLSPCRFALFHGAWCELHRHYYFPDKSYQRDKHGKLYLHEHYDIDNLDIRTFESLVDQYSSLSVCGSRKEKREEMKRLGFSSSTQTPFFDFPSIRSFFSFPIDPMHLLYENVARFILDIWITSQYDDLSYLSSNKSFEMVNNNLMSCQQGISADLIRSQRGLNNRGDWKANEFKTFVTLTSLSVMDQWVPDHLLSGWLLFVKICLYSSAHNLSRRMLEDFEVVCKSFFRHFMSTYYKYEPKRLHLCRYVIHLILHLPRNVERSGPVSLLGQWSMENYAGSMNRRCNATDRFAESVFEGAHLEMSTKVYCIRNSIPLDLMYVDPDASSVSSSRLISTGEGEYQGYTMRHPKTVAQAFDLGDNNIGLIDSMARFYSTSKNISLSSARNLVEENPTVIVWERLECSGDVVLSGSPCMLSSNHSSSERHSCYFMGVFEEDGRKCGSYGKARMFIEHKVDGSSYFLVFAEWVSSGFKVGKQEQVFWQGKPSSPNLFSIRTVESVSCIRQPIGITNCKVPNKRKKVSERVYFCNPVSIQVGLISGRRWDGYESIKLKGVSRK